MRDSVIYGIAASLVVVGVALTIGMAPKSNSEAKLPEVVAQNMVEVAPPTAEALNTPAKPPQGEYAARFRARRSQRGDARRFG
jgi:hypothetical protein